MRDAGPYTFVIRAVRGTPPGLSASITYDITVAVPGAPFDIDNIAPFNERPQPPILIHGARIGTGGTVQLVNGVWRAIFPWENPAVRECE